MTATDGKFRMEVIESCLREWRGSRTSACLVLADHICLKEYCVFSFPHCIGFRLIFSE